MTPRTTPTGAPRRGPRPGIRPLALLALALVLCLWPAPALAYVGPGAGFAFVTSFFLLFTTLILVLLALVTWPARALWRVFRAKKPPKPARVKRVVVVGLDGLDPRVARTMMEQGKLPTFSRLAEKGAFRELGTTCPSISPVAWSTFATGVDPSRHGIFDFLAPDRRTYRLRLSSTDIRPPRRHLDLGPYRIPLSKPSIRSLQRGVPFWKTLGEYGVPSSILRVPITYPPQPFAGTLLSAMCTPDLLGTQGSFTFFTEQSEEEQPIGGRTVRVTVANNQVKTTLEGPPHPLRRDGRTLTLPIHLRLQPEKERAVLRVGGKTVTLTPGRYTDWVELRFSASPGLSVSGICRFRLNSLAPLSLYCTPLNIDPAKPATPVAHPFIFSVFLAKLMGRYATLGLAEDTWALNEGALDETGFLEQVQLYHKERETMFFRMLERTPKGVVACVFDATDRVQHMFMREYGNEQSPHHHAIEGIYRQSDELLARVLQKVDIDDPKNLVLVVSDHGFASFDRGINLNTWLIEKGYMALREGFQRPGEYLEGVDWSRTRAYALGLSGLYLNLKGREAEGIVEKKEAPALRQEIGKALLTIEDPGHNPKPIQRVFDPHHLYKGPFMDDAPDLIVGYARGYRASWDTARGMGGEAIIEDNVRHWSGDHCMDPREVPGVLFASQPLADQARMVDLAPTLLELFGISKPPYMTGRSLCPDEDAPQKPTEDAP